MSIQPALNTAIYTAIGGTITSAGSRVYFLNAPDNPTLPYVIWDYVNEGDRNDTSHRLKNCVLFIRAYATTPAAAGTIDGQIDTALHEKTLSVSGWTNIQTRRENGMSLAETDAAGKKTYMCGADYRILNCK
jgi:hypothetical protein